MTVNPIYDGLQKREYSVCEVRRMNRLTTGIIALLAAAAGAGLTAEYRTQARLRQENESLIQQSAALDILAAENTRLSNLLAQVSHSLSTTTQSTKELLRLRGEVGVLRRQNQELAGTVEGGQRAPIGPAEAQAFEPSASWTDAGNATPQTAAETFCWAIKAGNAQRLAAVLLPPEGSDGSTSAPSSEVAKGLEPLLSQIEASRLLVADSPAPDETTLWFQSRLKGGETLTSPLTLKRVGNEWKVKLSVGP